MTNQEIFGKVRQHLLTQRTAATCNGSCAYRAGDKACAVGALIPDNLYTPEIEGTSVAVLVSNYFGEKRHSPLHRVLQQAGFTEDQYPLLRDLQRVHDRLLPHVTDESHPNPLGRALCGLRLVAAKHKLACPEYELTDLANVLDYLEYATCPPLPT